MEAISTGTLITAIAAILVSIFNSVISLTTNRRNNDVLKEVEYLKKELNKENIAYQIYQSELAKRKFERLDDLYQKLSDYVDHVRIFLGHDVTKDYVNIDNKRFSEEIDMKTTDHKQLLDEAVQKNKETYAELQKSKIYINKDLYNSIKNLLNKESFEVIKTYKRMHDNNRQEFGGELEDKLLKHLKNLSPQLEKVEEMLRSHLSVNSGNQ